MKARFAAALIVASIRRKHGNTLIRALRKSYGDGHVLHKMDEPSPGKLLDDRERGKLETRFAGMPLDGRAYALGSSFRSPKRESLLRDRKRRISTVARPYPVHDQGERRRHAEVFIGFLRRLMCGDKNRVFLIVDRGPAHVAKKDQAVLLAAAVGSRASVASPWLTSPAIVGTLKPRAEGAISRPLAFSRESIAPTLRNSHAPHLDELAACFDLLVRQGRKPSDDQPRDQSDTAPVCGQQRLCRTVGSRGSEHSECVTLLNAEPHWSSLAAPFNRISQLTSPPLSRPRARS
jgi:hypothetical protein